MRRWIFMEEASFWPAARQEAALQELRRSLPVCERFGLTLTEEEMAGLEQEHQRALAAAGRVEFGGGVLPQLIAAFCDSPYVERANWAQTLCELQEAFYFYKSEAEERFTDDELVEFMAAVFNGCAQGSTEYLAGTSLEELCRRARRGGEAPD